ncbi:MAG: hypothetical protein HC853_09800 [Anaerolineae bacterium]|nr:hypothetical protein [Anaerolineae bacterium]
MPRGPSAWRALQRARVAANSLCAYALYITSVEPLSSGLVFERFLNELRDAPADIDIDFAARDREAMLQYVYERYGRDHAAILCTYSTFGAAAPAGCRHGAGLPQEHIGRDHQAARPTGSQGHWRIRSAAAGAGGQA